MLNALFVLTLLLLSLLSNLESEYFGILLIFFFQLHAVTRINKLRSLLSAVFWRHCMYSGEIQSRALPRHEAMEI